MNDYYLKFLDEAHATSVLYRIEGVVEANPEMSVEASEGYPVANYANIDIIGTLYEPLAPMIDPEATPVAPVALDGYHVNVRVVPGEDSGPLLPFSIVPTVPRRVWG